MPTNPFSSPPYDDLVKVGATAKEIAAHSRADGWEKLFSNRNLRSLSVAYLTQDQADRLSEIKTLESLELFNGLVSDLSSLANLRRLHHLHLACTGYIKDFSFLARLRKLQTLKLRDVTKLKDFSLLSELPSLHTLCILRMGTSVSLPTLASLAKLTQLRVLHLSFDAKDGALSPLGRLSKLRELTLPLCYELEEYARLAVALPRVRCSCFTKPYGLSRSPFFKCKRCGGLARITLAKGHRSLCPTCDDDRFRAYLKTFEEIKAEFRRKTAAN
jgi:hypothetical protein